MGGKCRENHPFLTGTDGLEAVKQLGKATMCGKIDNIRRWDCVNRTCELCKDKVLMEGCPLQHSDSLVAKWKKQIMVAVDSGASGAGGTVEDRTRPRPRASPSSSPAMMTTESRRL